MFWKIGSSVALATLCVTGAYAQQAGGREAEVKQLVQAFRIAEQNYDVPALTKLIGDRYVEISPAGEVDEHDRFLGFYTPDKRVEWPPVQVSEETIRVFGDTAIDILKFTYTMPAPGGGTRSMEIRASYTAQRQGGVWKLLGSQYIGIRPAPAK